ncbi:MAG: ribonuclease PH [Vampirovibrionales bacterium]|nr:ribonuclease PH [Vampirovibrionales bacterium]
MTDRADGRQNDELRPIRIIRRYTRHAAGSVLMCYGDTHVLATASIEERVPRHVYHGPNDQAGWLTAEYSLLPGSTNTRTHRERYKLSGRTAEIQRLIGRSLRACIDLSRLGQRTITIDADVLQADGGTRVAAITGGYVALMDALRHLQRAGKLGEIPLISPVAAVSVGVIDGDPRLDLNYEEDVTAEVDANVVMNGDGAYIEVQATSEKAPCRPEDLQRMLDYAKTGVERLLKAQADALAQDLDDAAPPQILAQG